MNRSIQFAWLIGVTFISALALEAVLPAQEKTDKIALPDDPNKVVLRLDIRFPRKIEPPKTNPLEKKVDPLKAGGSDKQDNKTGGSKSDKQGKSGKSSGDQGTGNKGGGGLRGGDLRGGDLRGGDLRGGDLRGGGNGDQSQKETSADNSTAQDNRSKQDQQDQDQKTAGNTKQDKTKKGDPTKIGDGNPPTGIPKSKTVIVPRNQLVLTSQPDEPLIEIYADGRVKCGRIRQGSISATSRLSEEQLQQLMSFVINEQKFFEIDSKEIEKKVTETEKLDTRNFAQYTFTVATKHQEKQVAVKGIRSLSKGKPFADFVPIQQLAQIDQRLNQLFITINVGGRQNMIKILQAVNEQLKKKNAQAPEFSINDATFVAVRQDGSIRLTFGKTTFDEEGRRKFRYVATFRQVGGQANINIYGYGK